MTNEIVYTFDTYKCDYKNKINIDENMDNDCYVYAANNPRYLLGMRFDKIEDYTRSGMCDEIKACEYPI